MGSTLTPGGAELDKRVDYFNTQRDNQGLLLFELAEELFNVQTSLSTLDQLQAQAQEQLASISHIPLVVLLGLSPHGLNASSEGEIRAFYAWIKSFQEYLFREPLDTVIGFIQLSLFGAVDEDIVADFKDLWQLDAAGKAAIQKTKADTRTVEY